MDMLIKNDFSTWCNLHRRFVQAPIYIRIWKVNSVPELFRMKNYGTGIRKCDKISISEWWINSKINIWFTWPLESWTQYSPSCLALLSACHSTCRAVAPYILFALVRVSSKPSRDQIIKPSWSSPICASDEPGCNDPPSHFLAHCGQIHDMAGFGPYTH